jgi:cytoskeleton protein RodZ
MKQDRKSKLAESRSMMSAPDTAYDAPSGAPRVGADLRAARQRLGWELPEVAAGLRIRLPHLEALEDGRIADLPGNAYALGFLRTYAAALGLDADELARRFKAEAAAVNRKTELAFPAPVPERGVPAGAVVLLGAILAVGAYVGWYRLSGEGKLPAEVVAPVPARLAPLAEQAVPPTPPAAAPASTAPATPAPVATAGSAAPPTPPSSAAAALPPASPAPTAAPPAAIASAGGAAGATPAAAPPPPSPDGTRIVLRAKSDAWMQVRDRGGQVLLNRVLHAGDTWAVPVRTNLLLTTGNAGGTEVLVDGITTPALGAPGVVRRDIPLDPDQIKDGKLAVATPPPARGQQAAMPAAPGGAPATTGAVRQVSQ